MMARDWKAFVLEHGWRVRVHHLAAIVQQPVEAVARVQRCARRRAAADRKGFAELFALWHGRPPGEDDWPAPKKLPQYGTYEWLSNELAVMATLVGRHDIEAIAAILTTRLRQITGDPTAERTRDRVLARMHDVGLQTRDVQGGLTIAETVKLARRKDVTRCLLHQEISKGRLRHFRIDNVLVIPRRAFNEWLAARLPEPPDGWVKLWDYRRQLGQKQDRLSWYAKQGLIPQALFCAGWRWWVPADVARELVARWRAGGPMPWSGYAHPSTTKRSYALWQSRRHTKCSECAKIWNAAGGEPKTFEEFHARWLLIPEERKRHLTAPDGLSAEAAGDSLGIDRHTVLHAIRNGVLPARRIGSRWVIARRDLDRWAKRECNLISNDRSRSHRAWSTLTDALGRYLFSERELRAAIKRGEIKTRTRTGTLWLRRYDLAALNARVGGHALAEAAKRAGVSSETFLAHARARRWHDGERITSRVIQEVRKRVEADWQLTFGQAAKRLRRSEAWVRRAVDVGVLKPLRGVDRREIVVGRKAVDALIRKGIPNLPPVAGRGRPIVWLPQFRAAEHAGVTVTTLLRWRDLGELESEQRIDGPYYSRTSVEQRARRYWTRECRRKREQPPAWLQASTTEAA